MPGLLLEQEGSDRGGRVRGQGWQSVSSAWQWAPAGWNADTENVARPLSCCPVTHWVFWEQDCWAGEGPVHGGPPAEFDSQAPHGG